MGACGFDRAVLGEARARSFDIAREWRANQAHRVLDAAFDAPDPTAEAVAERAGQVLADPALIDALLAPLVAALAADPFFEAPLRVARDPLRTGAVLYEHPRVSISAAVLSAGALASLPPPRTVVVPGRLSVTRYVRAGGARLRLWRAEPAGADFSAADAAPCRDDGMLAPADGDVVRFDGRIRGYLLAAATSDVVTIVATVRPAGAFTREYAVADGRLVRAATLDDGASRTQMLLTLLRLSGRADAGPRFAAAAREGPFFLRWAAMREWLALDAGGALPTLARMAAEDPHREVRAAAAATLPLVEARIAQRGATALERAACPA